MRYDPVSSKWVGEFEKDWYSYDWHEREGKHNH